MFLRCSHALTLELKENILGFEITIRSACSHINSENIAELKKLLTPGRHEEISDYYWNLAGTNSEENELNLIGLMIDSAEVKAENNELVIKLVRKK
jgi:hypothetical protein